MICRSRNHLTISAFIKLMHGHMIIPKILSKMKLENQSSDKECLKN